MWSKASVSPLSSFTFNLSPFSTSIHTWLGVLKLESLSSSAALTSKHSGSSPKLGEGDRRKAVVEGYVDSHSAVAQTTLMPNPDASASAAILGPSTTKTASSSQRFCRR